MLETKFLSCIREYGTGDGFGYDHSEVSHQVMFGSAWNIAFVRCYDMTDELISLPKSGDLAPYTMMQTSTVQFSITLPTQVRGDVNPCVGLAAVAEHLTSLWLTGN